GRLLVRVVPVAAPGLVVERAEKRPGGAAVPALEDAGRLGADAHLAVGDREPGDPGQLQLALGIAQALARELPRLTHVGAAPDARAVPLAGGRGVDRPRLGLDHRVVDRPAVAEGPPHVPVATGLVALEQEQSFARPDRE